MRVLLLLLNAFFIFTSLAQAEEYLPLGWQPLDISVLEGTADYPFRKEHAAGYLAASSDIDGDGQLDHARFLHNPETGEHALFLSYMRDGKVVDEKFFSAQNLPRIQNLGIAALDPGEYKTACGKGYWECGEDEPDTIFLEHGGFEFFVFESASTLVFWDKEQNKISEITLSD